MTPAPTDDTSAPTPKPDASRSAIAFEGWPARAVVTLLPIAAIGVVYGQALGLGFVWDDGLLSLAEVYRRCDVATIFTSAANTFEYLPVRDLTLCVDHALFADWAGGFHLQNVLLFMIATVLLGSFYRRLFEAAPEPNVSNHAHMAALIGTMIFAMHPLQVEPVAFITARNALLALVFTLGTLVAYVHWIRSGARRWYVASVVCVVFAMFSKATALPVALFVALTDHFLSDKRSVAQSLLRAVPHLLVTACAGVVHVMIASTHGAMSAAPSVSELVTRLPRAAFVPQFYLYKFVWPFHQSTEYVLGGVRDHPLLLAASTLTFAGVGGVVLWRGFRGRTTLAMAFVGYLAALVPISNLFPTYPPVADRYAQIPLVFLTPLLLVFAFRWIPTRALLVAACIVSVGLGTLSFVQVPVWKTDESVFAHAFAVDPKALTSLENLAHTHWLRGNEEASLEAFAKLEAARPTDGQYALFRAWHAVRQRDNRSAHGYLVEARRKNVASYWVHMVQAEIYMARDNPAAARRELEQAKADALARFQRDARARVYLRSIEGALARLEARRR